MSGHSERVEAVGLIIWEKVPPSTADESRAAAAAIDALYAERIAALEARAQAAEALVAEAGEALGRLLNGERSPALFATARSVYHKITERGE